MIPKPDPPPTIVLYRDGTSHPSNYLPRRRVPFWAKLIAYATLVVTFPWWGPMAAATWALHLKEEYDVP